MECKGAVHWQASRVQHKMQQRGVCTMESFGLDQVQAGLCGAKAGPMLKSAGKTSLEGCAGAAPGSVAATPLPHSHTPLTPVISCGMGR